LAAHSGHLDPFDHVPDGLRPQGCREYLPHHHFHKSYREIFTLLEHETPSVFKIDTTIPAAIIMAEVSLADIIAALPSEDSWGPPTSTETTLNGVPYAPYSKGDKLGRMADWTTEGKDGRDGRGGRQQYNRNYRGMISAS
jgi:hypothetical protein